VTAVVQRDVRFNQIFTEFFEPVSRYCHRRLPTSDANDAVAEVFVVVWRKLDDVPSGEATLPWLYGVARHEVSRSRRSMRRRLALRARLGGQAPHPEPGPESTVVRHEDQELLVAALQALSPNDQEVLRLRAYEHLTIDEIAVVLGCSVSAAKQRSARAIKRLRRAAQLPAPRGASKDSRATRKGGGG
jgi:RNA polymerase sigma-70 factor, ECF subfamily